MRWYGKINREQSWHKCPERVLKKLIAHHLPDILGTDEQQTCIRLPADIERSIDSDGYFEFAPLKISLKSIEWLGYKPRSDSSSLSLEAETLAVAQLTAYRANGKPIAGVCFVPEGVFSLEEIEQALWYHFGSGNARNSPMILHCSSERPAPKLLHRYPHASHRGLCCYQCENPTCLGYRKPVLLTSNSEYFDGNRVGAIAYPCPRCLGRWHERWALTWMRNASPAELTTHPFVYFPIAPTELRRIGMPGPMASVVQTSVNHEPWGWHPKNLRSIPKSFHRFLRTQKPSDLVAAMRKEPELVGDMLPGILQRGNLRAMIDYVRSLPLKNRLKDIPTAFGHAFCPKRPSAYRVSQDAIQAAHHFYIAFRPDLFMRYLNYYGVADCNGSFLDVGSGIGEKPFLAYACGRFERCDGLEYDPRTLAVADFLLSQIQTDYPYPISNELGDALEFERYGDYDVIYMYRPLREKPMMRQLFLKIAAEMKVGATCMDVFDRNLAFRRIGANQYAIPSGVDSSPSAVWNKVTSIEDYLTAKEFPAASSS